MRIRREEPDDLGAIETVTIAAFASAPYGGQREHLILTALRGSGDLAVSLVAELDGEILGHAAASPVTISDGTSRWYGLGPVSVAPAHQKRGIGSVLVREVLRSLTEIRAAGCVVLGDPKFYERFGFRLRESLNLRGVRPEYFQALAFEDQWPRGEVTYAAAFTVWS